MVREKKTEWENVQGTIHTQLAQEYQCTVTVYNKVKKNKIP